MKFHLNENCTQLILKESTKEEYNQLKLYLSRFVEGYRFMPRYKLTKWDGKIDYFKNGFINFGLWSEIKNCCDEYGFPFIIDNKDKFPVNKEIKREDILNFCNEFYKDHKDRDGIKEFTPYEHQIDALFKILKYNFGLIEVATAGGKSLIFGSLIFYYLKYVNPNAKFLLIVPRMDLVTQFYNDILDYNYGFNKENQNPLPVKIDEIFSDKPRKHHEGEPNVFIGTYQSLVKWPKEWFEQFDVVCADEGHSIKASTVFDIMERTFEHAKIRYGMSGTFPKEGTAELFTIESVTGPRLMAIKARALMEKGLISNVKINCIVLNYEDKTFAENVFSIKKNGNGKKAYDLEKKYVQESVKRKQFLQKLVAKFDKNSIVLFHNIDYGTELYNYFRDNIPGIDFYYIDGSTPKEKREHIKKVMEDTSGNVKVLVASFGTTSTGINIRSIAYMVFADSFKSYQIVVQSIGRSLRLHNEKEKAIIFDIVDRFHKSSKNILYNHYITRKKEIYDKQEYPYSEINVNL